jgi:hypothetical protein
MDGLTFEFCRGSNDGIWRRGGGAATYKTGDKRVTNAAATGKPDLGGWGRGGIDRNGTKN